MNQASFFCPQCQQQRLFQSQPFNHILYLLISVFLCVLGFIIWILSAASHVDRWHCSSCGYTDEAKYLANPNLRQTEHQMREQQHVRNEESRRLQQERLAEMPRETISDNIRYFFSAHTVPILGGGIAIVLVTAIGFAVFVDSQKRSNLTSTSSSSKSVYSIPSPSATLKPASPPISMPIPTNSPSIAKNKLQTRKRAEVISMNANLRLSPDSYSDVVDVLEVGTTVNVVKQRSAWFYVTSSSGSGWIHGNTIRFLSEDNPY